MSSAPFPLPSLSKRARVPQLVLANDDLLAVGLEPDRVPVDDAGQPRRPALESPDFRVLVPADPVQAARVRHKSVCVTATVCFFFNLF